MDTNEVHVGSLACMRLGIETAPSLWDITASAGRSRFEGRTDAMPSDAHHLGVCVAVGARRGTP